MAHPQHQMPHQYIPRAFSPPQQTPSPQLGGYPPPKRQRLSPNGQSPYSSPNLANGTLPNQMYSNPNYGPQPNGYQTRPDAPNMQIQGQAGAMGPPSRPADNKPVDVNDLSDVLAGSGVDLREEEAALVNRYSHPAPQVNGGAYASDTAASFNSIGSAGQAPAYQTPYANFNTLSPNVPGDRNSFYGAGTFNQPAVSAQSVQQQAEAARKREIRKKAEREQHHLNDPFLFGSVLSRRLKSQAQAMHVQLPMPATMHEASPNQPVRETPVLLFGADGHEVLTVLRGQPIVTEGALSEIFTLLSLASLERIRTVIEDTATLAKGRRVGSNGIVAPDLLDLAIGIGNADPATTLPTPGNSAVSPTSASMKRSFSDQAKFPTPASEGTATPLKTIAFPNQLAHAVRKSYQGELSFEDARAARRSKRTANGLLSGEGSRVMSAAGTPGPSTPSGQAPDVDSKKAPSKKEQRRQADAKASEAQQHAATNTTTRMALGLGGKKFSWLSGGGSGGGGGFPVQRASSSSQSQAKTNGAVGGANGVAGTGKRKFGDLREDLETGRGIQMRDLVMVLEPEAKEKRTLARAYNKLRTKD